MAGSRAIPLMSNLRYIFFSFLLILSFTNKVLAEEPASEQQGYSVYLPIAAKHPSFLESTGILDPGFGENGRVITDINGSSEYASATWLQADGNILIAGTYFNGANYYFVLLRYEPDGSLDNTFGAGGIVTTDFGHDAYGMDMALQGDGKIIVAGYSIEATIDAQVVLARYNPDGTLDGSFGEAGLVRVTLLDHDYFGLKVAIQTDGKIVVAGYIYNVLDFDLAAWRFNPDGTPDTTFGDDGLVSTDINGNDVGQALSIQVDGKIIVAGNSSSSYDNDITVVRYNSDGSLDQSFDGDGVVITDILAGSDFANDITLLGDGKILVAGEASLDFVLVRYNPDGGLDASFGNYGWVMTDFYGGSDAGADMALQSNGKILVAGNALVGESWDFALVRYNPDGSLDTSFGGSNGAGGLITTDIGGGYDGATGVVVQPDGKIVVVGSTYNGADYDLALVRYK